MALKTFTVGEILTASDVNVHLMNTIAAMKSANESVTSSTTLQDDNHLSVTVASNSIYEMTFCLYYTAELAGDLKFQLTGPGSSGGRYSCHRLQTAAATEADDSLTDQIINTSTVAVGGIGASPAVVMGHGIVETLATAGTFKVQWAQNTSNGNPTTVLTYSYICLRRIL